MEPIASIVASVSLAALFGALSWSMRSRLDAIAQELRMSRKELGIAVNQLREEIHRLALDGQRTSSMVEIEIAKLEQKLSSIYVTKHDFEDRWGRA